MTRPSADCEVWLDGSRLACHVDDLRAGIPTVLDGLSINWGRSTVLDQPEIGTCTFKLRDEIASSDALQLAHVGADLAVFATGAQTITAVQPGPVESINRMPIPWEPAIPGNTSQGWVAYGPIVNQVIDTNLVLNPNLDAGSITGYMGTSNVNWSIALTTTSPIAGTNSILLTRLDPGTGVNSSVAGLQCGQTSVSTGAGFPITAGQTIYASISVKFSLANRSLPSCTFQWLDAANAVIGTSGYVNILPDSGAANKINRTAVMSAVAPANTVSARVIFNAATVSGLSTVGETAMFDQLKVSTNSSPIYFDGDTPADASYNYVWTGTARSSTSQRRLNGNYTLTSTSGAIMDTNLATNPGLEGGVITGWNSNNSTYYPGSIDTTAPISGTSSYMQTRSSSTPNSSVASAYIAGRITGRIPVTVGVPITVSIDVKTELAARVISSYLYWYDTFGNLIGNSGTTIRVASTEAGTVYRIVTTGTPIANTVDIYLIVSISTVSGNAVTGERVWMDNLRASASATDTIYFDGDTPADDLYTYAWSGTARSSTSYKIEKATRYQDRPILQMTNNGGNSRCSVRTHTSANLPVGLTAGTIFNFSCWIRLSPNYLPYSTLQLTFRDDPNNDSYAAPIVTIPNPTPGVWTRISTTQTVKAGRTVTGIYVDPYTQIGITVQPVNAWFQTTAWQVTIENAGALIDYFDGDTSDGYDLGEYVYAWTGVQAKSTSTKSILIAGDRNTYPNGGFESTPYGTLASDRYLSSGAPILTITSNTPATGQRALLVSVAQNATVGDRSVWLPPAKFQPVGGSPIAWSGIPQMIVGDTWQYSIKVKAPVASAISISARLTTTPYSADVGAPFTIGTATGTGAYQTITGTLTNNGSVPGWAILGVIVSLPASDAWVDQTTTWSQELRRWNDVGAAMIDDMAVFAPSTIYRRALVFSGSITDVVVSPVDDDKIELELTGADIGAAMENDAVGDVPWPVQTVLTRSNAITALAHLQVPVVIDATLQSIEVSYRDVDAQPVLGLLQDLAQSIGAALWTATHGTAGSYFWMEDSANRASSHELDRDADTGKIIITGTSREMSIISASDVLRDPVALKQTVSEIVTAVNVTWLEQTVDQDGLPSPTERTVSVVDQPFVEQYGRRRLSISTELITSDQADLLANKVLAQSRNTDWRIDHYTLDTHRMKDSIPGLSDDDRQAALLDLLDGTTRIGKGLTLIDMPKWMPSDVIESMYVEGGTYNYVDHDWALDLQVTPSIGQGRSARWGELPQDPAWAWKYLDPEIRWSDLYGVAAPS